MPITKDFATTTWNSFRRTITKRPRHLIGAAATVALLLAVTLTTLVYSVPAEAQTLSTDATLSALTVSPRDIIGFDADRNAYSLGVASTVTQVTVSATPNHSGASAVIYPTDADTVTDGHQVNVNPGLNRIAVDVTAEDTNTTENYTITIGQSVSTPYGWKAEDDLDGLVAAGNEDLYGMWRDATTTWVVDDSDTFVYAYNRDGSRNTGREFDLHADNGNPSGAWSNGTTVWIADYGDNNLFAYLVSNGTRQAASDISLHSDNELANGVWSNGTTIWVGDGDDKKLYAYLLADSSRQQSEEIDVASNLSPKGFWSDDTTMWVVEGVNGAPKILAYSMDDGTRIASRDFDTLATAEVSEPVGLWSDGESMWTTDSFLAKVFAFNMPPSNDARLSSLTVSPRDIIGFDTDRNVYALGVDSTVSQVTISATASHSGATVAISPRDTSSDAGHQVTLSAGVNDVNFIVTAEDGNTRKGYRVVIGRGVTAAYGWKAEDDLDGLKVAGNEAPWAIWGNATTIWVLDSDDTLVYAYNRDGSRDTGNGFDLHADNAAPSGAWSNGATVWISDLIDDKLYAYQVSNGVRQASLDLDLHDDNGSAYGVWSDGTTIWVADFSDHKLYAYLLDGGTRQPDADIDLSGTFKPIGIWSNSITMWVAFQAQTTIFAYELDDGSRIASKDFATPMAAGLSNPTGLWSDRRTMWAANEGDAKVYAFNMPGTDATLSALTVSPKNIIGFKPNRTSYAVGVDHTVTQVTISGTPTDSEASVAITPVDADAVMDGHQVGLSAGANPVTVTVTSEGGLAKDYTITIGHGIQTNFGWKAGDDLDGLIAASNQTPSGIWGNATTTWVVDVTDDHVYVYNRNGSRDTSREFDLHADNARAFGAWSNGQTVWISDFDDDKLYAYRVRDGMRQTSLEIDLHTDNGSAYGVWSNGTTVWVSDLSNDKLYAYGLFNGVRQPTDDITTSAQDFPQGIWSDGAIIWVTDAIDVKIYAYNLADGSRIASKDFNTPGAAGARIPTGLWSYGQTMWMADESEDKVYAFNMPRSENVNLTAVTVDSTAIPSFIPSEADGAAYEHGVAPSRTQVTVTATKEHAGATVTITPSDVSSRSGHQVNLSAGANPVTITVTAADRITTAAHTLNINRGVTGAYGWQAEHDLDGLKAAGNDNPQAIWTDGETIWVLDYNDTYVYAYDRVGNRVNDKWIDLHADNDKPTGIWSDETTMWVSDRTDKKLYAYTLAGSSRDTGKEFNLDTSQGRPLNIWSDGDTIWVVDFNIRKLFAYVLEGGARLAEKDIDVIDTLVSDGPIGLWSNEITLWITQNTSATLFAYRLDDGSRDTTRDFTTLAAAGNSTPASLTGDAGILWAMDAPKKKAFAYNVPGYVPNQPATGAPRISDTTPLVDQVLTVDLSRIRDRNGLADVVYSYQWMTTDGTTDTPIPGATGDTFTVTDAQAGSQLKVTVSFRDHDGHRESLSSAATAPVPIPEAPGAPRSLQAGESDETLRLTWRAPSFNGNAVITSYVVEYKLNTATTWLTATRPTDPIALMQEIAGLTNDSPYDLRVAAVNSEGPGAWAAGTGTPNPFYRAPDKPQEVSAASGDESMTVTWNTPAHNGNGRITGYKVEYRLDGQTAWQKVTSRFRRQHDTPAGHNRPREQEKLRRQGRGGERVRRRRLGPGQRRHPEHPRPGDQRQGVRTERSAQHPVGPARTGRRPAPHLRRQLLPVGTR